MIGYFGFDKSLGDVARRIHGCLRAADVPAVALDYHRSGSPPTRERPELTDRLRFDTNLIVVNADQMPLFDADYGAIARPGRHTIGYWFWDVEHVPQSVLDAMRHRRRGLGRDTVHGGRTASRRQRARPSGRDPCA